MKKKLIAAAVAALLALPAPASAATKVYAGTTEGSGQLAMDVVVSKHGKLRWIKELRGKNVPVTCEQSGTATVYFTVPDTAIKVNKRRKFRYEWTQPTYGNESWIRGVFAPKRVATGTLYFNQHFPAENGLPEENCVSGELDYRLDRGAPDVIPGPPRLFG